MLPANLVHAKLLLVRRSGVYVYKDENVGLTEPASPSCVNISISASCSRIRLLSLTCSDHQNTAGSWIHSLLLYIISCSPVLRPWSRHRRPSRPGSGCCCCCTFPRWAVWDIVTGCVGDKHWKKSKASQRARSEPAGFWVK